jgi:hypothetical protein
MSGSGRDQLAGVLLLVRLTQRAHLIVLILHTRVLFRQDIVQWIAGCTVIGLDQILNCFDRCRVQIKFCFHRHREIAHVSFKIPDIHPYGKLMAEVPINDCSKAPPPAQSTKKEKWLGG